VGKCQIAFKEKISTTKNLKLKPGKIASGFFVQEFKNTGCVQ